MAITSDCGHHCGIMPMGKHVYEGHCPGCHDGSHKK